MAGKERPVERKQVGDIRKKGRQEGQARSWDPPKLLSTGSGERLENTMEAVEK